MRVFFYLAFTVGAAIAACGGGSNESSGVATSASASSTTAATTGTGGHGGSSVSSTTGPGGGGGAGGSGGSVDKAANCTDKFGNALTNAFGRLDGTVLAVVKPTDVKCPFPNNDHVVVEVVMNGDAYRLVVNVQSSFGDPNVRYVELPHAMPAPAWAGGWHTGLSLDYVADFGVHSDATFTAYPLAVLSDKIADAITIGQKISVYAQSSGGSSAHQIHRNDGKVDGAMVLDPDSAKPRVMLFHFGDQTF